MSISSSIDALDREIAHYFDVSRQCRSSTRNGQVLVLDDDRQVVAVLQDIIRKHGLPFEVCPVDDIDGLMAILKNGEDGVKAIVAHESMVDYYRNGSSVVAVLDGKYPKIPVWIVGNGKKRKEVPKRVGFIESRRHLMLSHVLGLSG